ncbi:hypothetical protein [Rhodococcoides kyotonense]|uniref:PknH-like extracellular domain-containing protein n=1 Tax=Rhodococcoides kyotonense TaxID=398843 RepID=A0A239KWC5_9NOCA|nr:hypothetical protein [Rhodococcus kyotonensis]SNT22042.1 hypothetical protein SAMN05421642_111122 [Rhodococcus kyotonensis]
MRRVRLGAVVGACAVICAACGNSADEPATTSAAPIPAAVAAPDPLAGPAITDSTVLQSAMIPLESLPPGYTVIPDPVRDLGLDPAPGYDDPDRSGTDPQRCADVLAPISQQFADAAASAEVRYSGPDFSSIDEDAASYTGRGAADAFAAVQAAFADCGSFTGTDADGIDISYTLEGRDGDVTAGDASVTARLKIESGGFTLVSDVVVAVVDSTVVQVVATDQDGVDDATLSALAQAAVDGIRGVSLGA